jgi:spermidine/putrescine transport system ATP-binding protein
VHNVLEISNIHKSFAGNSVLEGIDLKVEHGEFLTLLGPSGCGKTTLLRSIAGFETPDSGEILIEGKPVFRGTRELVPAHKRGIGFVFQSYALWPHLTVTGNVEYGLRRAGLEAGERRRKVRDVLEVVGLSGYENRLPSELSGGQAQRVAVARALVNEPAIILFDEPLSNLDAKLRKSLRMDLKRLQSELRMTAIYVTHDQTEALALSDRIVIMRSGSIVEIGEPADLFRSPKRSFTADFVGDSNLVPYTRDGKGLVTIDGSLRFSVPGSGAEDAAAGILAVKPADVTAFPGGTGPSVHARGTIMAIAFGGSHYEVTIRLASEGRILFALLDEPAVRGLKMDMDVDVAFRLENTVTLPISDAI